MEEKIYTKEETKEWSAIDQAALNSTTISTVTSGGTTITSTPHPYDQPSVIYEETTSPGSTMSSFRMVWSDYSDGALGNTDNNETEKPKEKLSNKHLENLKAIFKQ
jgi:hypothetical protein